MKHEEKSNAMQRKSETETGQGSVGQTLSPPKFSLSSSEAPVQRKLDEHTLGIAGTCRQLFDAMDGLGTDEDAIYAALRQSCGFDPVKAKELRAAYRSIYGTDLVEALEDELSGGELGAALIYAGYYPSSGAVLGTFQCTRAQDKMKRMNGATLAAYTRLIESAGSNTERQYIHKALAADNRVPAIQTFAARIRGKNEDWMRDHLQLANSTGGRGLQQQWNDSCGPSTVETVRGQLDPIYALQVHDQNPNLYTDLGSNGASTSPNIAADQSTMLSNNGGVAVQRGSSGGAGSVLGNYLGDQTPNLGTNYRTRSVSGLGGKAAACDEMNKHLDQGLPVAIRVSNSSNSGGHFATVISRSGNNYSIQDPWSGATLSHTRSDFVNNTLNVAGWNLFTHIYTP